MVSCSFWELLPNSRQTLFSALHPWRESQNLLCYICAYTLVKRPVLWMDSLPTRKPLVIEITTKCLLKNDLLLWWDITLLLAIYICIYWAVGNQWSMPGFMSDRRRERLAKGSHVNHPLCSVRAEWQGTSRLYALLPLPLTDGTLT